MSFSKIDTDSVNTVTSALNFFEIPGTNVSASSASFREILSLNPLSTKPYNFTIHATSSYIDLSKCFIFTEMQILKRNALGTEWIALEAADVVAPVQMIGSTFIKNMKIAINNQEIYDSNSMKQ